MLLRELDERYEITEEDPNSLRECRHPSQVVGLLKSSEVVVIPFHLASLPYDVSALKFYEYLAAGLAVVSTPLREVKASEAHVVFAHSKHEFARELDEALVLGKDRQELLDFASENTWKAKLRRIETIMYGVGLPGFSEQTRRESAA